MKKLIIIFSSILMPMMLATSVFAQHAHYCLDFLEPGNPGGRTTGLKTCDLVSPVTVNPGSTFTIDIWAADFLESLLSGGFQMTYNPAEVSIVSVQAYDGVDIPGGPWDGSSPTFKLPDADADGVPGPYVLAVLQMVCAFPDAGLDIILARVTFQCLAEGSTIITVKSITGLDTTIGCSSGEIYDTAMGTSTITITQGQTTTTTTTTTIPYGSFCKGNFDYDKDIDGTDAAVFKQYFGRSQYKSPCPPDGPAPVEKTQQLTPYQVYDNGWFNNGLAWPNPRFTDNGNGSVTDNLTGLIWLKNAYCLDVQANNWYDACSSAYFLHGQTNVCGLTDGSYSGDWRLPNVKELQSLIDFNNYGPALPSGHPFTNVQSLDYWTSTTDAYDSQRAWLVFMANGYLNLYNKTSAAYIWPVRGGH